MIEVTHDALEEKPLHWNAWKGLMSVTTQRVYLALRLRERTIVLSHFAREVAAGQTTVLVSFRELESAGMLLCDDDVTSVKVLECPPTTGVKVADKENLEDLIEVWATQFRKRTEKTYQRGAGDVWQAKKLRGRNVAEFTVLIEFFWNEMNDGKAKNFSYFVKNLNDIIAYKAEHDRNAV